MRPFRVFRVALGVRLPVHGPADLQDADLGSVIEVSGSPTPATDPGRWASALGLAALRGATIRRTA